MTRFSEAWKIAIFKHFAKIADLVDEMEIDKNRIMEEIFPLWPSLFFMDSRNRFGFIVWKKQNFFLSTYGFFLRLIIIFNNNNNNNNNNLLLIRRKYLYEYIQMRLTSSIKIIIK